MTSAKILLLTHMAAKFFHSIYDIYHALPIKLTSQLGVGPRIAEAKGSNPVQA